MSVGRARRRSLVALVAVSAAAVLASTSIAGSVSQNARNGQLAYTVVTSALQIYAQTPGSAPATRVIASDAVDFGAVASPDGTRIAFVSGRDGNDELYVARSDGTDVRRLTRTPAAEQDPAWSPDSRRIAFSSVRSNSELYVVAVDGTGLTRLTYEPGGDDESPTWSPDGSRIAFDSDRDDDWDVYVMNADGTGTTALTTNDDDDSYPAWSPDGKRIAFTSDRDRQGDDEIFAMSADGGNVLQLTVTGGAIDDWSPAWSPDGSRIAFVSNRTDDEEIFVMAADGKGLLNVTANDAADFDPSWTTNGRVLFTTERAATLGIEAADTRGAHRTPLARIRGAELLPEWSPDGKSVAFVSERGERSHLFVATAGRRPRQLTRDPAFEDSYPTWSRDGRRITFVREDEYGTEFLYSIDANGRNLRFLLEADDLCCPEWSPNGALLALALDSRIVVVDANGKGRRLITGTAGDNASPTWSPDGRWIAFASNRSSDDDTSDWNIFVVPATGGPARQLTVDGSDDDWPDWSPDGRLIAFSRGDLEELESSIYVMRADGKDVRRVPLQAPAATPSWQAVP
ncbi:MAG TPA: hypothetical protein VFV56_03730 [Gaiellaceae bacterium]|nr:hypothetical protein [Gaiellaceae bacterium]